MNYWRQDMYADSFRAFMTTKHKVGWFQWRYVIGMRCPLRPDIHPINLLDGVYASRMTRANQESFSR